MTRKEYNKNKPKPIFVKINEHSIQYIDIQQYGFKLSNNLKGVILKYIQNEFKKINIHIKLPNTDTFTRKDKLDYLNSTSHFCIIDNTICIDRDYVDYKSRQLYYIPNIGLVTPHSDLDPKDIRWSLTKKEKKLLPKKDVNFYIDYKDSSVDDFFIDNLLELHRMQHNLYDYLKDNKMLDNTTLNRNTLHIL